MLLFVTVLFGFHGIIENDTTWSDTAYLTGDVWVNSGVTLTIAPGTVVLYADSCEWDTAWYIDGEEYPKTWTKNADIVLEGNLKAVGSTSDSIYFCGKNEGWEHKPGLIIMAGEWDTLRYCEISLEDSYLFLYYTDIDVKSCWLKNMNGIDGMESNLILSSCTFDTIGGHPVRLEGGNFNVSSCLFTWINSLGDFYSIGGVIHAVDLDTCLVNDVHVNYAWGFFGQLEGGNSAGCFCSRCSYVEITNSSFKNIDGGFGNAGAGVGGSGGGACAICLDSCNYVFLSSNIIDNVRGGDGEDGSMYGGYGGSGAGIGIRQCSEVSIDNSSISRILGGSGEASPNNENDGVGIAISCNNSSPSVTNNQFNNTQTSYITITEESSPTIGGAQDKGNIFYNPLNLDKYVIENKTSNDIDATWNFWECSPSMIDSLIFDYYDDPTKGIVHYDNFTDVEEKEPPTELFTLRSNLVNDILHVSFSRDCAGVELRLSLFDASGRRVLSMPISAPEIEIDVSAFPRGVYFISVSMPEKSSITHKVILN